MSQRNKYQHLRKNFAGDMQVKTILAHNCYKCHGSEKITGELRLDSKKRILKGVKTVLSLQPVIP